MDAVIVAGLGRCGTTVLYTELTKANNQTEFIWIRDYAKDVHTGQVHKTHKFPPATKLAVPCVCIFLFGDPLLIAKSVSVQDPNWIYEHHENMDADPLQAKNIAYADTLRLEEHFDAWHRPQQIPTMTLRYETMHEHIADIQKFTGINLSFQRKDRLTTYSMHPLELENLTRTYARLKKKIDAAPDITFWDP